MKVLVACEFSGIVRDAFIEKGHKAISCDFLDTETEGPHYKGDVRSIINNDFDLLIAHPPCQHLAVSGARWFKDKQEEQKEALEFVKVLLECNINKICLENPVSIISTKIRKPDQIIQPWMFGHSDQKTTCLWLKNLPLLEPTDIVETRDKNAILKHSPSEHRAKDRSRTYKGIARAMAEQWSI
ncbi:MAG: DNA cytosine methyltransferase [Candidatus Altiarchaeales archaeon]|nr:DNA cytosine methyltransferase [Candidatus Altiarchaeales archaeon]